MSHFNFSTTQHCAGVTMQSQVRRKPNCFNLLHQMQLLEKMKALEEGESVFCWHHREFSILLGLTCDVFVTRDVNHHEVWTKAAQIADAYVVGRAESQAALNLLREVSPSIVERLAQLVQWPAAYWNWTPFAEWLHRQFPMLTVWCFQGNIPWPSFWPTKASQLEHGTALIARPLTACKPGKTFSLTQMRFWTWPLTGCPVTGAIWPQRCVLLILWSKLYLDSQQTLCFWVVSRQ